MVFESSIVPHKLSHGDEAPRFKDCADTGGSVRLSYAKNRRPKLKLGGCQATKRCLRDFLFQTALLFKVPSES